MFVRPEFEREYKNLHGETWRLYFDPLISRAAVTGDDVGWDVYPVYEGTARNLVVSKDESEWLISAWGELMEQRAELDLYAGKDSNFIHYTRFCELSGNFCPLCLAQKSQFDIHHCIASAGGGTNDPRNLLRICRSCHVVLTAGSIEDRIPKERAAFWHQVAHFGFDFFPPLNSHGGRHPDVSFHEQFRRLSYALALYAKCHKDEQQIVNQRLMQIARVEYQYFRDLGLGKWPWKDFKSELEYEDKLRDI